MDSQPSWNPAGTRIVYRHGRDFLQILDLTSGAITDIGHGFDPKWSPDGRAIAYSAEDGIRIRDIATGQDSLLYDSAPYSAPRAPAWSWDSQSLAIELQADTLANGPHILVVRLATGAQEYLGTDFALQPCWMPGDSVLVVAAIFPDGKVNLATLNIATRTMHRLLQGGTADRMPAVSPDGTRIAWLMMASQPGISVMPSGGGVHLLVASFGQDPVWSADGTRILYSGYNEDSNTYTLWTMRPDGTDKVRLTAP